MVTKLERDYTVTVVIGTQHAGLKFYTGKIEDELIACFAALPEARAAKTFCVELGRWLQRYKRALWAAEQRK